MSDRKTREEVGQDFLVWCEKIGHAKIEIEIQDGLPIRVLRSTQSIRFDLTNNVGDSTME